MKRFKTGQQIVCVAKNPKWEFSPPIVITYLWGLIKRTKINGYGPKFNEIVTCDGYSDDKHIYLQEYSKLNINDKRGAWAQEWFEPLIETSVLESELSSLTETVNNLK